MVTNFLNTIKMEAGKIKLELEDTNICEMLREIINEYEPKAKEKNNKLIFEKISIRESEVIIKTDHNKIKEVFINLVDNAIKFTSNGIIKITCDDNRKETIISVEDNGAGIPQKDIDHIFDKFFQVQNANGNYKNGTGLGLYIVKSIVVMQGGKTIAESEINKGTRFTLTLPKDI